MDELVRILIEKNLTFSCIDFLDIDFASHFGVVNDDIYKGTLVSTHADVIIELLDINQQVEACYGCDSQEFVGFMAIKGKEKFQSDVCLAYSGYLSCEENDDIYLAIAYKEKVSTFCFQLSGKRSQNIEQAILLGIEKTLRMINEI